MTNKTVEAVARAICLFKGFGPDETQYADNGNASYPQWEDCVPEALATNKALVEALEPFANAVYDDGHRIVCPDKDKFLDALAVIRKAEGA